MNTCNDLDAQVIRDIEQLRKDRQLARWHEQSADTQALDYARRTTDINDPISPEAVDAKLFWICSGVCLAIWVAITWVFITYGPWLMDSLAEWL